MTMAPVATSRDFRVSPLRPGDPRYNIILNNFRLATANDSLESLEFSAVGQLLKASGGVLTGSCFHYLLQERKGNETSVYNPFNPAPLLLAPKDYDFFFPSEEGFNRGVSWLKEKLGGTLVYETINSTGYKVKAYSTFDLVTRTYGSPQEILSRFDFTVAMAGLYWSEEQGSLMFIEGADFREDLKSSVARLHCLEPMEQPLERVFRYHKKKFRILEDTFEKSMRASCAILGCERWFPSGLGEDFIASVLDRVDQVLTTQNIHFDGSGSYVSPVLLEDTIHEVFHWILSGNSEKTFKEVHIPTTPYARIIQERLRLAVYAVPAVERFMKRFEPVAPLLPEAALHRLTTLISSKTVTKDNGDWSNFTVLDHLLRRAIEEDALKEFCEFLEDIDQLEPLSLQEWGTVIQTPDLYSAPFFFYQTIHCKPVIGDLRHFDNNRRNTEAWISAARADAASAGKNLYSLEEELTLEIPPF